MSLADQSLQWYPTSVQVTVLQARGLRIKGKNGTNDAYAIMQVAKEKFNTSVSEKCVAPVWKEEATFELPLFYSNNVERCNLQVCVMHRAVMGPDKTLGQANINLLDLNDNKSRNKTEWFKLVSKTGKADKDRGEVLLDIQFMKNNMTASMFDLSGPDKSRSKFGKLKDKLKGKKKDGMSDSASAIVPSVSQILTDSEEEEETHVTPGAKKKNKLKSLFVSKSSLHRNMSQSMSTLATLPEKDSAISLSRSSGLNVESPEGKKKFKFLKHKRTGSSDSKVSQGASSLGHGTVQNSMCINGSHVYTEEPETKASRASSPFSLNSSGHGSMEDIRRGHSRKTSNTSVDSLKTSDLQIQENAAEELHRKQEEQRKQEEEVRKRLEEEKRRQAEEENREQLRREAVRKEEERKWIEREEERKRIEKEEERKLVEMEELKRKKEEDERKMIEREEERKRIEKEEERKLVEMEELKRKKEEDERKRIEREEERKRIEKEEERKLVEMEELKRKKEEDERKRIEREEERKRIEKEEERKLIEREEERMRKEKEEERKRVEREMEERQRVEEEERERFEKAEMVRIKKEQERVRQEEECKQAEEESIRVEERMREMEKRKKMEEEEKARLEEEKRRRMEEEERARLEKERQRKEEETQRIEMQRRHTEEEERLRKEMKEAEEMQKRKVEEEKRKTEEKESLSLKERLEKERLEIENKKMEERMREEQERKRAEEEEKRKLKEKATEQERIRQEEEEKEKQRKMKEQTNTTEKKPEVKPRSARLNTVMKAEKHDVIGSEYVPSANPFEEGLSFDDYSPNPFEVPQPEALSCSAKVSAVKPSSSVSGRFFSQALVPNTNPFLDDSDANSGNTEIIVSLGDGAEQSENKRRAPMPPQNKTQIGKPDVSSRDLSSASITGATQTFSSRASEDSEDSDVSCLRRDKRPAPLPPGVSKNKQEVWNSEHADPSTNYLHTGEWRTPSFQNRGQSFKDDTRSSMTDISSRLPHLSQSQPSIEAETNPFISVGLRTAKHNKGPAPAKPSAKSIESSASEPEPNNLAIDNLNLNENTKVKSAGKLDNLSVADVPSTKPESVHSDYTDILSLRESGREEMQAKYKQDSHREDVSSSSDSFLNVENVPLESNAMTGVSKKKSQAPLPPVKLATVGEPNSTRQPPAGVLFGQPNRQDEDKKLTSSDVSTSSFSPFLANSSSTPSQALGTVHEKNEYAPVRLETGYVSGHKFLPQARVSPIDAQPVVEQSNGSERERTEDPASKSCRPHAVKPLSTTERPPYLIETQDNSRSTKIIDGVQAKMKAPEAKGTGRYSQLTHEELVNLLEKQKEQLSQKDSKIVELEQYIDKLLVRVMEEQPSILMSLSSLKKSV